MSQTPDPVRALIGRLVTLAKRRPFPDHEQAAIGLRHPAHGVFLVVGGAESAPAFSLQIHGPDPVPGDFDGDAAGAEPFVRDFAWVGLHPDGDRLAPVLVGASRGAAELRRLDGSELARLEDLSAMLVAASADDALPTAPFLGGPVWFGPVLAPRDGGFATRIEWFDPTGARGTFAAGRVVAGLPECDADWLVAWRELPATAARYGHSPRCVVVVDRAADAASDRPLCADVLDDDDPATAVDSVVRLLLHGAAGPSPARPRALLVDDPSLRAALYIALADSGIELRPTGRVVAIDRIVARLDAGFAGG